MQDTDRQQMTGPALPVEKWPDMCREFAASTRGVEIILATSHQVTADLDARPIVAQDVVVASQRVQMTRPRAGDFTGCASG
jgi:hypothetical protein